MKFSLTDVKNYSFCPQLYAQSDKVPLDKSLQCLKDLIIYLFRRDMETGKKTNLSSMLGRWKKICYSAFDFGSVQEGEKFFNLTLPAINEFHRWYLTCLLDPIYINHSFEMVMYDWTLYGEALVVLFDGRQATLITLENILFPSHLYASPTFRFLPIMLMEKEIPVSKVINLSLQDFCSFSVNEFCLTRSLCDDSLQQLIGVMDSLKNGVLYSNFYGCPSCVLKDCQALKGND